MRGTVKHQVGRKWLVQLDQVAFERNVLKWPANRFRVIEEPQASATPPPPPPE
jgi:hypothetical protein